MQELLITNTEEVYDHDSETSTLRLWGRDVDRKRHPVTVIDYEYYFYATAEEARDRKQDLLGENGIVRFDFDVDRTPFGGWPATELVKVYVESGRARRRAKESFIGPTWEADVGYTDRFRIDFGVKAWVRVPGNEVSVEEIEPIDPPTDEEPDPRVVVFDIETDDRGAFPELGERAILSIVAYDSYEQEYHAFLDTGGRAIEEVFNLDTPPKSLADLGLEEVDQLHFDPNERQMLIRFGVWVQQRDPDILTGWNFEKFDAPYTVERMLEVGASPARLSPSHDVTVYAGEASISGRTVYDLLFAYKKNRAGELRSFSLDAVAEEELGENKLYHEEGIYELWENDVATLLNYNGRDTRLTAEIDRKAGVISFRDRLRKIIGVDFESTKNNYQFIEMLVRRKLFERGEVGPTKTKTVGSKYEGAYVVEPYSGLAYNVVGIDLSSLYPMTMKMLNTSPEVKIPKYTGDPIVGEIVVAPNGVAFSLEKDGLFREIVDDALELKAVYKELKNEQPPGSPLRAVYQEMYDVAKTIVNSIYGVIGWIHFFLYDRETAEAVTLAGQAVLKRTKRYVDEETAGSVVYGDTDSNYVKFPKGWSRERCLEEAQKIADHLNEVVYPELAESMGVTADQNEWFIEIEMFADRFLQWGKKKRYAYRATWKEGMALEDEITEPDIVIKGSAAKRSDASLLTKETERALIDAIMNDASESEIIDIVYSAAVSIDPENPDLDRIGIPGGLRQNIKRGGGDDSYRWSTKADHPTDAHPRAAWNSNHILGTEYDKGSKPKRVYINPTYFDQLDYAVDVLAFETPEELEPIGSQFHIDAGAMTTKTLVNPLSPLLEAVGVDADSAVSGQSQTGLGAFL